MNCKITHSSPSVKTSIIHWGISKISFTVLNRVPNIGFLACSLLPYRGELSPLTRGSFLSFIVSFIHTHTCKSVLDVRVRYRRVRLRVRLLLQWHVWFKSRICWVCGCGCGSKINESMAVDAAVVHINKICGSGRGFKMSLRFTCG